MIKLNQQWYFVMNKYDDDMPCLVVTDQNVVVVSHLQCTSVLFLVIAHHLRLANVSIVIFIVHQIYFVTE